MATKTVAQAKLKAAAYSGRQPDSGASWSVYCGDAAEVLATLPADHFPAAITSPPYYWQRDYKVPGQIGLEPSIDGYVSRVLAAMTEVKRVLHPKGVLFLNLGDTYYSGKGQPHGRDRKHPGRRMGVLRAVDASGLGVPKKTLIGLPWRVALAMIEHGWILRAPVVWRRACPIPEPSVKDRPWRTYEFVFMFTKSRRYWFCRDALVKMGTGDVWTIPSQSQIERSHPAVFPRELVARCLDLVGHVRGPVLDPFVGSGTVVRESMSRGLDSVGIDLSPKYCRVVADAMVAGR